MKLRIRFVAIAATLLLTLAGCTAVLPPNDGGSFPPDETVAPDKPLSPEPPAIDPDVQPPVAPDPTLFDVLLESTVDGLRVRSGEGSVYPSLGTLDKGDMVAYVADRGDWYETVYREKKAYISKRYATAHSFRKSSAAVEAVIEVGKTLLGHPYVWGAQRYHWGNGKLNTDFKKGAFDCSSLVQYAYFVGAGVKLNLNTRTQVLEGATATELRRGDLLFFTNDSRVGNTGVERVGHVALYLGDNMILHTASDHAVIESISAKRQSYFIVAKRHI